MPAKLNLYHVEMKYPARKVATHPGCEKTCWKYRTIGPLIVRANTMLQACKLVIAHLHPVMPKTFHEHHRSCRLYVCHMNMTDGEGIKFPTNGDQHRYDVQTNGIVYWPAESDKF